MHSDLLEQGDCRDVEDSGDTDEEELEYFGFNQILTKVYGDAISFRHHELLFGNFLESIYKPPLGHFPDSNFDVTGIIDYSSDVAAAETSSWATSKRIGKEIFRF